MADYDYSEMTQEDYDRILIKIINEEPASNLFLTIPNIYSDIAEHFNNEVLSRWENEREGYEV